MLNLMKSENLSSQTSTGFHDENLDIRTDKLRVMNVQRSCVHDGPGIRTTIFFQGCALKCIWCQNPEAQSFQSDIAPDRHYSISDIMEIVLRDKEYYFTTSGGVTLTFVCQPAPPEGGVDTGAGGTAGDSQNSVLPAVGLAALALAGALVFWRRRSVSA